MDFTVEFYETKEGRCPVQEFLDALKISDPDDHSAVLAGFHPISAASATSCANPSDEKDQFRPIS